MKKLLTLLLPLLLVGCSEFNRINLICIDRDDDELTIKLNLNQQSKKVLLSTQFYTFEEIAYESNKITTYDDKKYMTSTFEEFKNFYEFKIIEQVDEINTNCEFECDTSISEWTGKQIPCELQEMLYKDIDKKQCLLRVKNYKNKLANSEIKVRVHRDDLSLRWIDANGDVDTASCRDPKTII